MLEENTQKHIYTNHFCMYEWFLNITISYFCI